MFAFHPLNYGIKFTPGFKRGFIVAKEYLKQLVRWQ
jgi:hypothetical protein